MEKTISSDEHICNEALQIIFKVNYFRMKQFLQYSKFPTLYTLLMSMNAHIISNIHHDEKTCSDLIRYISVVIQKKIICWIQNSSFFGIMVDESIDISAIGYLVIFATIIEEDLLKIVLLDLL